MTSEQLTIAANLLIEKSDRNFEFGKHYILTNKFSRNDGILYSRLQTMREKADYQNTFTLSESEGRDLLNETQQLQARLTSAIKERASRS